MGIVDQFNKRRAQRYQFSKGDTVWSKRSGKEYKLVSDGRMSMGDVVYSAVDPSGTSITISENLLTDDNPLYDIGDTVEIKSTGDVGMIKRITGYNTGQFTSQTWEYEIELPNGSLVGASEHGLRSQAGGGAATPKSKYPKGSVAYLKEARSGYPVASKFEVAGSSIMGNGKIIYDLQDAKGGVVIRDVPENILTDQPPRFNVGDDVVEKNAPNSPLGHIRKVVDWDRRHNRWEYEVRLPNGFRDYLENLLEPSQAGGFGTQAPAPAPAPASEDKPEMVDYTDPRKEQRKEQLDERLYDLYFQKDQEEWEGEMNELLVEYKELTGQQAPRFIAGKKRLKNPFHVVKAQPHPPTYKYRQGQKVWAKRGIGTQAEAGDEYTIVAPFPPHRKYEVEDSTGKRHFIEQDKLTDQEAGFKPGDIVQEKGYNQNWLVDQIAEYRDLGKGEQWHYTLVDLSGSTSNQHNAAEGDLIDAHQSGSQQQPSGGKFQNGDKVYIARPKQHSNRGGGSEGDEVTIVSDPMQRGIGDIEYYVQKPGRSSVLWPEKWLVSQKPKYSEGDKFIDHAGEPGTIDDIYFWNEGRSEWVYDVTYDDGATDLMDEDEFASVNSRQKKQKETNLDSRFKMYDRVRVVDSPDSDLIPDMLGKDGTVIRFDYGKNEAVVEFPGGWTEWVPFENLEVIDQTQGQPKLETGDRVEVTPNYKAHPSMVGIEGTVVDQDRDNYLVDFDAEPGQPSWMHAKFLAPAKKRQTQQEQLDERQSVDPDETRRQDYHPSQQELMSHIKDTGTPYFPPTPEGQKAFEEFLIKQHNEWFEDLKKNWGMLIKKYGKKGQLMVRKQKDALYVHAMKYARKA